MNYAKIISVNAITTQQKCGQFVANKLANLLLGRVYVLQSIISLHNPRYDA